MTPVFVAGFMAKVAEVGAERWRRAKAHVALGHEQERRRLQHKGLAIGTAAGAAAAVANSLARRRFDPLSLALLPAGSVAGHLAGGATADRRLVLSQSRERHGHYAPREKVGELMTPIAQTAKQTRAGIAAVKRPHLVPPTPDAVKPPAQAPAFEPTTKIGAELKKIDRRRGRKSPERLGEPQDGQWSGSFYQPYRRGPENEPVSYRSHDA